MTLGKPIGVYRFQEKKTAPDSTNIVFVGPEVRKGTIVVLDKLEVANYSAANKMLVIGIREAGGSDHYMQPDKAAQGYYESLKGKLYLLETEKPIGIVESPGTGNVLYFTAHGLVYKRA